MADCRHFEKNMKSPSTSGLCRRINHSYYSLCYCRDMVISNLVTMEDCDSECRSQPEPVFTLLTTISQPLKPKDLFLNYLKTVHGLTLLIESVKNWTVNISLTQISTTGTESFTHKVAALEFCLQDGSVLRVLPTRWRRWSFANKMAFGFSEYLLT